MTTRSNGRGTIVLDRIVPVVGRIKRASGTNEKTTFKYINAMITTLQDLARFDILRAAGHGGALIEHPVAQWIDVGGSKLTLRQALRALTELARLPAVIRGERRTRRAR